MSIEKKAGTTQHYYHLESSDPNDNSSRTGSIIPKRKVPIPQLRRLLFPRFLHNKSSTFGDLLTWDQLGAEQHNLRANSLWRIFALFYLKVLCHIMRGEYPTVVCVARRRDRCYIRRTLWILL